MLANEMHAVGSRSRVAPPRAARAGSPVLYSLPLLFVVLLCFLSVSAQEPVDGTSATHAELYLPAGATSRSPRLLANVVSVLAQPSWTTVEEQTALLDRLLSRPLAAGTVAPSSQRQRPGPAEVRSAARAAVSRTGERNASAARPMAPTLQFVYTRAAPFAAYSAQSRLCSSSSSSGRNDSSLLEELTSLSLLKGIRTRVMPAATAGRSLLQDAMDAEPLMAARSLPPVPHDSTRGPPSGRAVDAAAAAATSATTTASESLIEVRQRKARVPLTIVGDATTVVAFDVAAANTVNVVVQVKDHRYDKSISSTNCYGNTLAVELRVNKPAAAAASATGVRGLVSRLLTAGGAEDTQAHRVEAAGVDARAPTRQQQQQQPPRDSGHRPRTAQTASDDTEESGSLSWQAFWSSIAQMFDTSAFCEIYSQLMLRVSRSPRAQPYYLVIQSTTRRTADGYYYHDSTYYPGNNMQDVYYDPPTCELVVYLDQTPAQPLKVLQIIFALVIPLLVLLVPLPFQVRRSDIIENTIINVDLAAWMWYPPILLRRKIMHGFTALYDCVRACRTARRARQQQELLEEQQRALSEQMNSQFTAGSSALAQQQQQQHAEPQVPAGVAGVVKDAQGMDKPFAPVGWGNAPTTQACDSAVEAPSGSGEMVAPTDGAAAARPLFAPASESAQPPTMAATPPAPFQVEDLLQKAMEPAASVAVSVANSPVGARVPSPARWAELERRSPLVLLGAHSDASPAEPPCREEREQAVDYSTTASTTAAACPSTIPAHVPQEVGASPSLEGVVVSKRASPQPAGGGSCTSCEHGPAPSSRQLLFLSPAEVPDREAAAGDGKDDVADAKASHDALASDAQAQAVTGTHEQNNCNAEEEEEERFCRICREDATEEPLVAPCACTGSVKWIHRSCLDRWRLESAKRNMNNVNRCEICKHSFTISISRMTLCWEGSKRVVSGVLLFVSCFVILAVITTLAHAVFGELSCTASYHSVAYKTMFNFEGITMSVFLYMLCVIVEVYAYLIVYSWFRSRPEVEAYINEVHIMPPFLTRHNTTLICGVSLLLVAQGLAMGYLVKYFFYHTSDIVWNWEISPLLGGIMLLLLMTCALGFSTWARETWTRLRRRATGTAGPAQDVVVTNADGEEQSATDPAAANATAPAGETSADAAGVAAQHAEPESNDSAAVRPPPDVASSLAAPTEPLASTGGRHGGRGHTFHWRAASRSHTQRRSRHNADAVVVAASEGSTGADSPRTPVGGSSMPVTVPAGEQVHAAGDGGEHHPAPGEAGDEDYTQQFSIPPELRVIRAFEYCPPRSSVMKF